MCSIIGSFDKNKIVELFELNKHRGNTAFSLAVINPFTLEVSVARNVGQFDSDWFYTMASLEKAKDVYYVLHIQAPTTKSASAKFIHPAEKGGVFLWHNGVIKSQEIKRLQEKHKNNTDWDTELLLDDLKSDWFVPNVDGGFACLLANRGKFLRIFRTTSCPLFIDKDFNISSVKFDNVPPLRPDVIYELDLVNKKTSKIGGFTSKDNPYYFAGQN